MKLGFARFALAFALLLVFASVSHALDPDYYAGWQMCDVSNMYGPGYTGMGWLTVSVTGIFLLGMLIVVVYLLGTVLTLPKLVAWSRSESYQVLASVLILIALLAFIPILVELGRSNNPTCWPTTYGSVCGSPDGTCTMMQTSYMFSITMRNTFMSTVTKIVWLNTLYRSFVSAKYNIEISEFLSFQSKIRGPMGPGIFKLSDWAVSLAGPAMVTWMFVEVLICFINNMALSIILPLGLIFRSFPLTRSVGGGLIALALVSYFVIPMMLNIDNVIISSHFGKQPIEMVQYYQQYAGDPSIMLDGDTPFNALMQQALSAIYSNSKPILNLGTSIKFYIGAVLCPASIGAMFSVMYYYVMLTILPDITYLLVIATLVLQILNVFIIFSMLKEVAKFFGSDMSFSSLSSLI